MAGAADLNSLLKLLDDETPVVREAVTRELSAMRHNLPDCLDSLGLRLTLEQERLIDEILEPVWRDELEETWLAWRWLPTQEARIEEALTQVAALLGGWKADRGQLSAKLDALAGDARAAGVGDDPRKLAEFLFGGRGSEARLRGNISQYYAAENSSLLWVIEHGVGNPISLCCIYLLVGSRLGIHIEGCNFPGHFLARVYDYDSEHQMWLVDCFNRGRFMAAEDVSKHHPAANPSVDDIVREPAGVEVIIGRVLRNLDDAFAREGNLAQRQIVRRLMLRLMKE